jgi:teichuronic acid exporter
VSLKQKTIHGIFWSAIDSFANQGVAFIVGIILARLLTPREFGLIGMITIFIALSQTFINSGFTSALIRKKDCTQADYSTVFYYNLAMALLLYIVLFASAGGIGNFFDEPELKWLIRVLGIDLLIRSVTIIQSTIVTKRVDFKLHAKVALIAGLLSGATGIAMALNGFWRLESGSPFPVGCFFYFPVVVVLEPMETCPTIQFPILQGAIWFWK